MGRLGTSDHTVEENKSLQKAMVSPCSGGRGLSRMLLLFCVAILCICKLFLLPTVCGIKGGARKDPHEVTYLTPLNLLPDKKLVH